MTKEQRAAMQQALDALVDIDSFVNLKRFFRDSDGVRLDDVAAPAIDSLRAGLAKPEQKSLTDEQIIKIIQDCPREDVAVEGWVTRQRVVWGRAIEATLRAELAKPAPVAYGWMIEGSGYIATGEHAEIDAKDAATRVGGACRAFAVYRGTL